MTKSKNKHKLPVAKREDVEFSKEVADRNDIEALERGNAADKRQDNENQ